MRLEKAFTLVEVLVVVLILGILGAIVIPRFSNASAMARASMLADSLRMLRTQLTVFESQHLGVAAGYPGCDSTAAPTEAALTLYLTKASKATGETAEPGTPDYDFGPYMREMPSNPVNQKNTVQMIGNDAPFPTAGDNSHGWVYQPETLNLRPDSPGLDTNGKSFFSY